MALKLTELNRQDVPGHAAWLLEYKRLEAEKFEVRDALRGLQGVQEVIFVREGEILILAEPKVNRRLTSSNILKKVEGDAPMAVVQ